MESLDIPGFLVQERIESTSGRIYLLQKIDDPLSEQWREIWDERYAAKGTVCMVLNQMLETHTRTCRELEKNGHAERASVHYWMLPYTAGAIAKRKAILLSQRKARATACIF